MRSRICDVALLVSFPHARLPAEPAFGAKLFDSATARASLGVMSSMLSPQPCFQSRAPAAPPGKLIASGGISVAKLQGK